MNNTYEYSSFNSSYPTFYNGYGSDKKFLNGGNDDRIIGAGFAFPFLLGGVTGAAIAPAFWRPGFGYNRPYYGPYYGPGFYGPYRPF